MDAIRKQLDALMGANRNGDTHEVNRKYYDRDVCCLYLAGLCPHDLFQLTVVLAAQLLCWTGQFIGHGAFEKRAPALLDNLSQALLMAPFFVLLELLQTLFHYEPYPGFHAKVSAKIEADRKQWQASKQKKSS